MGLSPGAGTHEKLRKCTSAAYSRRVCSTMGLTRRARRLPAGSRLVRDVDRFMPTFVDVMTGFSAGSWRMHRSHEDRRDTAPEGTGTAVH